MDMEWQYKCELPSSRINLQRIPCEPVAFGEDFVDFVNFSFAVAGRWAGAEW